MGKNLLNTNYVKEATEKWLSNIVIPQVYDDSLSYYEEINKIIGCLNEMGNAFETLPDAVQEILRDTGKLEVANEVYTAIAPVEENENSSTKKEAGDLMWLKKDGNSTLYECITPIDAGTIFVIGKNIKEVDINTKIKYLYEMVSNNNEHYNDRAEYTHDVNSLFIYKDRLVKANTQINVNDLLTDKYSVTSVSDYVYNNFKNIEANKTEISKLKQADTTLQNHIDDEVTTRTEDIENVNSAITAEREARISADKTEENARISADNTEKNARISADNQINQKLTQETTERKNEDAHITIAIEDYWKTIYPVGSIYISTNSTFNPQTTWGGTWVKTAKGRCLIGANDTYPIGSIGGESSHTLTVNELPPHKHGISRVNWYNTEQSGGLQSSYAEKSSLKVDGPILMSGETGNGNSHNNMQPYLSVHIWERTA